MQETLIRDAALEDAADIVRLIQELAAVDGDKCPLEQHYVETYLSQPGSYVLLAELTGHVIGLLSYSFRPNLYHAGLTCLIEELVVDAPFRGTGIGGALLDEALRRAKQGGCAEISVTTMPDNRGAIAFYRRHGLTDEAVYLEMHF